MPLPSTPTTSSILAFQSYTSILPSSLLTSYRRNSNRPSTPSPPSSKKDINITTSSSSKSSSSSSPSEDSLFSNRSSIGNETSILDIAAHLSQNFNTPTKQPTRRLSISHIPRTRTADIAKEVEREIELAEAQLAATPFKPIEELPYSVSLSRKLFKDKQKTNQNKIEVCQGELKGGIKIDDKFPGLLESAKDMPLHPAYNTSLNSDREILRMHHTHTNSFPSSQNTNAQAESKEGDDTYVWPVLPKLLQIQTNAQPLNQPVEQQDVSMDSVKETKEQEISVDSVKEMDIDIDTTMVDENKENIDPSSATDTSRQYDHDASENTPFGTPRKPKNISDLQLTPVKDSVDMKTLEMMRRFGASIYDYTLDQYNPIDTHHLHTSTKHKGFKIYEDYGGEMDITHEEPHYPSERYQDQENKLKSKYGRLNSITTIPEQSDKNAAPLPPQTPTLPPQKLLHKSAKSKVIFMSPVTISSLRTQKKLESLKTRFPRNMYENGKKKKDLVDMIRRGEGGVRLIERERGETDWTEKDLEGADWKGFDEVEMTE
ncbi:hypothetical protein TWF694_005718 [Orbilia ellipsospora]|uniref:Uncharacterized protein n=1 Tax=Orbilia ellipsospora TaxID=2528407 RepID=A0AAV9WS19_9PEZI